MKRITNSHSILIIIILAGLFLRLWGLDFGLPYQFHQDEPIVVNHALAYGTGDFNPHFFAIPPLTSYLLFIVYGIYFLIGMAFSLFHTSEEFAQYFFIDPSSLYIIGRLFIGVIPGIISIAAVYVFSGKFLSKRAALFAASVMSICFLNVVNSHYIYTDMLLVMFTMLAYGAIYSFYKIPVLKNYCVAGILIGLAVGIKYNAVFLAVPYVLTHFMVTIGGKRHAKEMLFSGKLWLGAVCAVFVFAVTNPYMMLDWPGFLGSVSQQSGAFWPTGWLHHIVYSLTQGISIPLVITGGVGLFFIAFRKRWGIILFSFPFVFYLVIVFKSQHFARYVIPLIPFFAIGSAYLVFEVLYKHFSFFRLKIVIAFVLLILLVPTTIKSVKADMLFSAQDTRIIAAKWIKENLDKGSRIACASTTFRPTLKQPYSQVMAKKEFLSKQKGLKSAKTRKLAMMLNTMDASDEGFPLYFLCEDPEQSGQFLDTVPALPYDINALREASIAYIIVSGQKSASEKAEFIEEIKIYGMPVKDFSPYNDGVFRGTMDPIATTCIPIANKELSARKNPGPSLRIYKIK